MNTWMRGFKERGISRCGVLSYTPWRAARRPPGGRGGEKKAPRGARGWGAGNFLHPLPPLLPPPRKARSPCAQSLRTSLLLRARPALPPRPRAKFPAPQPLLPRAGLFFRPLLPPWRSLCRPPGCHAITFVTCHFVSVFTPVSRDYNCDWLGNPR